MRIGIKFQRKGLKKYVSHLDMQRLFARALRRSGLPVKYSSGFNPHINLSFASAMAVGMESEGEYVEFVLVEPMDTKKVFSAIEAVLPEGLDIVACGELPEGGKKLMAATKSALYKIQPKEQEEMFVRATEALTREKTHIAQKKKGNKIREIDIRPLIYDCKIVNHPEICVMIELALSGEASLSPALLVETLEKEAGVCFEATILRKEIYTRSGEEKIPLDQLFTNRAVGD